MSAVFELDSNPALFEREKQRFLASVAELEAETGARGERLRCPTAAGPHARVGGRSSAEAFTRPPAPEVRGAAGRRG